MSTYVGKYRVSYALWKILNVLRHRGVLGDTRLLQMFEELSVSDVWLLAVGAAFDHMPNKLADEAMRASIYQPLCEADSRLKLENWGLLIRDKNGVVKMPPMVRKYLAPRARICLNLGAFKP